MSAFVPSAPPWHLVSPEGDLHTIHSHAGLKAFLEAKVNLKAGNVQALVGILPGNSSDGGDHVKFWQPLLKMKWLAPVEGGTAVPLLGSRGRGGIDYFLKLVSDGRIDGCPPDTAFEKTGLQELLKRKSKKHAGWTESPPAYTAGNWKKQRYDWGVPALPPALPDLASNFAGANRSISSESSSHRECLRPFEPRARAHARSHCTFFGLDPIF